MIDVLISLLILAVFLILVFTVLLPALIDALEHLIAGVVYVSVVIAAFAVTTFVFFALWFEPDELPVTFDQLTNDAVRYLDSVSFWIWERWT